MNEPHRRVQNGSTGEEWYYVGVNVLHQGIKEYYKILVFLQLFLRIRIDNRELKDINATETKNT